MTPPRASPPRWNPISAPPKGPWRLRAALTVGGVIVVPACAYVGAIAHARDRLLGLMVL